jgi:transposase
MAKVFIGVDPHKLSATIEVVDGRETILATGRFDIDKAGYAAMRRHVSGWQDRVWAVEGSNGSGRPLAQRVLAHGEQVVDVPAKLSARARLFDTGRNRKTDTHDAHAVAVVAVRTQGLRLLSYDAELESLRMLVDRRAELAGQRVQAVSRFQRLLSELTPGKAQKDITALQAKAILVSGQPRDLAGKTRRRLAAEQLTDLFAIDKKIKASTKELKALVLARGSRLMDLPGVGPVVPPGSWPTSAMWPASPTATGSRPGLVPHHWMHPLVSRFVTASPGPGTGRSITCCTSLRPPRSGSTPKAAPTADANAPPAKHTWKPCAASSAGSPTPSTASSSPTPKPPSNQPRRSSRPKRSAPARERTAGRL